MTHDPDSWPTTTTRDSRPNWLNCYQHDPRHRTHDNDHDPPPATNDLWPSKLNFSWMYLNFLVCYLISSIAAWRLVFSGRSVKQSTPSPEIITWTTSGCILPQKRINYQLTSHYLIVLLTRTKNISLLHINYMPFQSNNLLPGSSRSRWICRTGEVFMQLCCLVHSSKLAAATKLIKQVHRNRLLFLAFHFLSIGCVLNFLKYHLTIMINYGLYYKPSFILITLGTIMNAPSQWRAA